MGLFKTKKKIFGKDIEPQCQYCRYNTGEDEVACAYVQEGKTACKRYEYDPLKREPKGLPKMRNYTADDFSL